MSERPSVPKSMSDPVEHARKLADAIRWLMDRVDNIDERLKARGI